jgi:hypothetical protein
MEYFAGRRAVQTNEYKHFTPKIPPGGGEGAIGGGAEKRRPKNGGEVVPAHATKALLAEGFCYKTTAH